MTNNVSYFNDKSLRMESKAYGADPATGGFFHSDYKKHEDLKQMLDSNKDGLKLEAMKRIIGMVAKGRDASDLFPAVVKNVVSKNIEVKKLVYVYLVRYAEEQQDLALLSISTFQRALKDPNQLIRASALRVLSSIRVPVIVPIVMLAIKDSASDMSPYVRKTAAHAIPKIYSLDAEQKEELIHIIEKLLSDKMTLVVGSAVMAFEEVCPERIDLIHKNYRKLCNLLVDVDEWGQVLIINMLTRYARTQFVDPNINEGGDNSEDRPFYDDDFEEREEKKFTLDPDYRLLLRSTKPLLQSRNAAVVMAVASLYHHVAPKSEVNVVAKSLIRLLRSHREVQSVVLNCIASISTQRKGMFEPYLKSFFVRTSDPTHIKLLKLEIMTNLATETNISIILREFQTYIASQDKEFVAATIEAIGRCASNIQEVTETCLTGLVALLSNRDQTVVAESVVVVKKLLQTQPNEHRDIIIHLAKLVENITVPQARASILWLLGEYSERVPRIAPDVLRKMAKVFVQQEDLVKLQIVNLAVKLYLSNPTQTKLLCQYVLNLAKYDQNYDIRDRVRFMRQMVFPSEASGGGKLSKHAKKIFMASKPAPILESKFKDRDQFQLGSLSHYINARSLGYQDLPDFPEESTDPSLRDVEMTPIWAEEVRAAKKQQASKKRSFYSESEGSSEDDDDDSKDGSSSTSSSESDSDSDDSSSEEDSSEDSESDEEESKSEKKPKEENGKQDSDKNGGESNSSDESSSDSSSEEESEESDLEKKPAPVKASLKKPGKETEKKKKKAATEKTPPKSNLDLLLDLEDVMPTSIATPVLTPSLGGLLTPMSSTPSGSITSPASPNIQAANPAYIPAKTHDLVDKVSGNGLQILYRFTRSPHLYSPGMLSVELTFVNHGEEDITEIKVGQKYLPPEMSMHDFAIIAKLPLNATLSGTVGVDFNDTTQPANFDVVASGRCIKVTLKAPVGEQMNPVSMSEHIFLQEQGKLRGMNENYGNVKLPSSPCDSQLVCQKIFEVANVLQVPSLETGIFRFAGQTLSSKCLVLISLQLASNGSEARITVNCEKIVIASMLLTELKQALAK